MATKTNDKFATLHSVCVTHMKWYPCLIKNDFENDCHILKDAELNELIRAYHNGTMSRQEVETVVNKNGHHVDWFNGVA